MNIKVVAFTLFIGGIRLHHSKLVMVSTHSVFEETLNGFYKRKLEFCTIEERTQKSQNAEWDSYSISTGY